MFVLGMDIGYSNVKLAMGESGFAPNVSLLPAGAAPLDRISEAMGQDDSVITVNLDPVLWGAFVRSEKLGPWSRSLHQDYTSTDSYRALFYGSLLLTERDSIDMLVTGLPVSQWQDEKKRKGLTKQLKGDHAVAKNKVIQVKSVEVIAQPAGACFDASFTGKDNGLIDEGRLLVIDPGYFSFDWMLLDSGNIRKEASGTSLEAMSSVLAETSQLIKDDIDGIATVEQIEEALRSAKSHVLVYGRHIEIQPYLKKAADKVATIAIEALRQSIRKEAGSIDGILLAGGGASLFAPIVENIFPRNQIIVLEQPELSNVRGFYYYGAE